jgi:protein-L-isoaspartate(D-aspartate) O-methyltransferase
VGNAKSQEMLRITRLPDGKLREEKLDRFSFVPLLGQDGWK